MLMRADALRVAHVAEVADANSLEVLARITPVLTAAGVGQAVVLLQNGRRGGERSMHDWRDAVAVELRPLDLSNLWLAGKVAALQAELAQISREGLLSAVHLHGVAACLIGSRALAAVPLETRILCSLHGIATASSWRGLLLGRRLQKRLAVLQRGTAAASVTEAQAVSKLFNRSAELLPCPVAEVFFRLPREEPARPSVLAGGSDDAAVRIASRLCVLLNGREARVRFAWAGAAHETARAALQAASVELAPSEDEAGTARRLARTTAYIELARGDGAPIRVAEAMAAAVPCLVSDIPSHRSLIHHGETGYICTSQRDLLERLVGLLRNRGERVRIGQAARAEAERRFALRNCQRTLLRAYGFSLPAPFEARAANYG